MSNCIRVAKTVEVVGNRVGGNLMKLAKEFANQVVVCTFGDDFHAVAGGKDHRFAHVVAADKRLQREPKGIIVECEPLTEFDRRRFMAESDECELHHWNVCRPPKILAPKNVTKTPMKPTIDRYAAFLPRQPAIRR